MAGGYQGGALYRFPLVLGSLYTLTYYDTELITTVTSLIKLLNQRNSLV
jgi:hypothetical protein